MHSFAQPIYRYQTDVYFLDDGSLVLDDNGELSKEGDMHIAKAALEHVIDEIKMAKDRKFLHDFMRHGFTRLDYQTETASYLRSYVVIHQKYAYQAVHSLNQRFLGLSSHIHFLECDMEIAIFRNGNLVLTEDLNEKNAQAILDFICRSLEVKGIKLELGRDYLVSNYLGLRAVRVTPNPEQKIRFSNAPEDFLLGSFKIIIYPRYAKDVFKILTSTFEHLDIVDHRRKKKSNETISLTGGQYESRQIRASTLFPPVKNTPTVRVLATSKIKIGNGC